MWRRRLRMFDIRHRFPWRKTLSIIGILLLVNTAIQWSLFHDVGTSFGQPDHRKAMTRARGGDATSLHDRVISINKWFDGGIEGGGEGRDLEFDAREKRDAMRMKDDGEPLITYITRKPSNRRPLGEALVDSQQAWQGSVPYLVTNKSIKSSPLLQSNGHNVSKIKQNAVESRQKLDGIRERILLRKRELIRNRSIDVRDVMITFLQKHQTKLRSLTKTMNNLDHKLIQSYIRILESHVNYLLVDIYSNERVRYYSRPGWFDMQDIDAMNFLTGSWILRRKPGRQHLAFSNIGGNLILIANHDFERLIRDDLHGKKMGESEMECSKESQPRSVACQAAWCSPDLALVLAFHLDRVIGLNVTPPTVARELPVGTRRPTAMQHVNGVTHTTDTRAMQARSGTLGPLADDVQVQTVSFIISFSMDFKSSQDGRESPTETKTLVSDDDQVSNDVTEKFDIFCFLLKITYCSMGADRWKEYFSTMGRHQRSSEATNSSGPQTDSANRSPVQVFITPAVPYEEEIDILWRLRRLSRKNASLLKAGRVRQRLLQSLFLDRVFWTEAGGRRGIEVILNVIDRRVKDLSESLAILPSSLTER